MGRRGNRSLGLAALRRTGAECGRFEVTLAEGTGEVGIAGGASPSPYRGVQGARQAALCEVRGQIIRDPTRWPKSGGCATAEPPVVISHHTEVGTTMPCPDVEPRHPIYVTLDLR